MSLGEVEDFVPMVQVEVALNAYRMTVVFDLSMALANIDTA